MVAGGYVDSQEDILRVLIEDGKVIIKTRKQSLGGSLVIPIDLCKIAQSELSGKNPFEYNEESNKFSQIN